MRVAVAGATGAVGVRTVAALEAGGHEAVGIARSLGVDARSGVGLAEALAGVEAVIDVTNTTELQAEQTRAFFGETTAALLRAGAERGVGHHVTLSIVGIDGIRSNGHYAGKLRQEELVAAGSVPWSIVRATQFHDFPAMVADWTTRDGVATLPPLLLQPVALDDVAARLVAVATGTPIGRAPDFAGPDTHDMVDMARRTLQVRGDNRGLRASWRDQPFGLDMGGEALLPAADALLGGTTFEQWLAAGAS